eukprot:scaffold9732_cov180-Amphora_coffeaeformis.AAC.3
MWASSRTLLVLKPSSRTVDAPRDKHHYKIRTTISPHVTSSSSNQLLGVPYQSISPSSRHHFLFFPTTTFFILKERIITGGNCYTHVGRSIKTTALGSIVVLVALVEFIFVTCWCDGVCCTQNGGLVSETTTFYTIGTAMIYAGGPSGVDVCSVPPSHRNVVPCATH